MSRPSIRTALIWLLIGIVGITILALLFGGSSSGGTQEISISDVIARAKAGDQMKIEVTGNSLKITDQGTTYTSQKEPNTSIIDTLETAGVDLKNVTVQVNSTTSFLSVFLSFLPWIVFAGLLVFMLWFMLRAAGNANKQAMGFGRSKARMFVGAKANVTFLDVAGVPEAKEELEEVVEFLRYPERFTALGARIPKGLLLVGPPGTGKTLLARAVAGEANVPFFSISGSEFVEMFVGVGASRVRDLFQQAKRQAPCIIFIDEIDAVGRHRGAGLGGGNDEREQTLNQILVEMDGFDTSTNVIVIAATNRPDILDPALLRPGRFDRRVVLDSPDIRGRTAILEVHAKGKPIAADVDLSDIAKQTPGFSGADLSNLINEAAILTARENKKEIGLEELTESIDRVVAGPARKSRVISAHEKQLVAYHEAGHAIVASFSPSAERVHKISIIARGTAGGYTRILPEEEHYLRTTAELRATIAYAMGGRSAEEVVFGEVTTGASDDIETASRTARQMVTRYGMSERLGPRCFGKREEAIFLGREISEQRDYSLRTEALIDEEVNRELENGRETAIAIIRGHMDALKRVAEYLLEHETVDADQIDRLVQGQQAPTPPVAVAGSVDGQMHAAFGVVRPLPSTLTS